jgi:hypothetical protein
MLLDTTKTEKLSHLDNLRRDRGSALLDNGKVPTSLQDQILHTEGEIYAIDEAIGEQARRDRLLAEQSGNEERAAGLAALRSQEIARLDAIDRAQTAAAALTAALKDALSISADISRLCANAGEPCSLTFGEHEIGRRLSGWLAVSLSTLRSRYRFGVINWTFAADVAFVRDAGKTWHESEAELGARALDPILNPKKETE